MSETLIFFKTIQFTFITLIPVGQVLRLKMNFQFRKQEKVILVLESMEGVVLA